MLEVAAFLLRAVLVLAIGGGLFLIISLLRLSYAERGKLAGQGYGARIRQALPARAEHAEVIPIESRVRSGQPTAVGPYGRGRRRGVGRQEGGIS